MIIGLTHALVVFRVMAAVMMAEGSWKLLSDHSNLGAMVLGAFFHYIIITVMTRVRTASPLSTGTLSKVCVCVCLFYDPFYCILPQVRLCLQINRIVARKLCDIGMIQSVLSVSLCFFKLLIATACLLLLLIKFSLLQERCK